MKTYPSEVDSTFYALLGINAIMSLTFCLLAKSVVSFVFVALLMLFILHQLQSIKYKIDSNSKELLISGGIFYHSKIDISSIESIKKENSMISAPAASFNRISIKTDRKTVRISPKKQKEFLQQIKSINPEIIDL